jgi:hypothetical protein
MTDNMTLHCGCGRVSNASRRCIECSRHGEVHALCDACAFHRDIDYCVMHGHQLFRKRGCGCRHCRDAKDVLERIEKLRDEILDRIRTTLRGD